MNGTFTVRAATRAQTRELDVATVAEKLAEHGALDPVVVLYPDDNEIAVVCQWDAPDWLAARRRFLSAFFWITGKAILIKEVHVDRDGVHDSDNAGEAA